MGHSVGRWEGDTLVVDVTDFNGKNWFDRAGNFHSEALHLVERFTPITPDAIRYEVTIEDPERLHAAVEDLDAALSPAGAERAARSSTAASSSSRSSCTARSASSRWSSAGRARR